LSVDSDAATDVVTITREGPIRVVTLNRPEHNNAVDDAFAGGDRAHRHAVGRAGAAAGARYCFWSNKNL
jgi:enoyl-CoA hydratase/carnithine racemase